MLLENIKNLLCRCFVIAEIKKEKKSCILTNNLLFCYICFVGEEEDLCLGLVNDPGAEVGAQTRKIYLLAL